MPNATIHCLCLNPALDIAAIADKVEPTRKIRVADQVHYPGGGAINVARVVDALDGDVSLSYLAGGAYGKVLQLGVADLAIPNHCIETDNNTRLSYTVFDKNSKREYRFVSDGEPVAEHFINAAMAYLESTSCRILVLSGSLPVNAPVDTYTRISASAASRGIKVVLDCSGEPLRQALNASFAYLVKPSFGELEQLAGKKLDESSAIQFAQSLVTQKRAVMVALTMGQNGAVLCTETLTLRAPAIRVKVRSAVGAGDSFVAGMIAMLADNGCVEDAFRQGIAAGAAAVITSGTKLCQAEHIHQLLGDVVVSPIK